MRVETLSQAAADLDDVELARLTHRCTELLAERLAGPSCSEVPVPVRQRLAGPARALELEAQVISLCLSVHRPPADRTDGSLPPEVLVGRGDEAVLQELG